MFYKKMTYEQEEQFAQFVRAHKERFYLVALSYTKNEQDALDVLQDSIQKAMLSIHKLQNKEQWRSWFYQIVVRTAIDFLRKHKRLQPMTDETLNAIAPSIEDRYSDMDLAHSLESLPMIYREVIVLHYFEDLKLAEVAEILQLPLSTAKSRVYKALKLLKIDLEQKGAMLNE